MSYSMEKGERRLAVEAALKRATVASPLSAFQVAESAQVDVSVARTHIGNCVSTGLAYNLNPLKRNSGLYVWGKRPSKKAEPAVRSMPTGRYYGEPATPVRFGSMDAYSLPSLDHTGQQIARVRPMLIGASATR